MSIKENIAQRILIIDDNPDICHVISDMLESRGYTSKAALSAEEAYAIAERFNPDVVLLDLNMPGIDGLDAMMLLKSYTTVRDRPIVIVSALSAQDMAHKTKELGAFAYVQKPFDSNHLVATIERAHAHHIREMA